MRPWAVALFVGLLAFTVWGSLTPSPPSAPGGLSDKVQHFTAYFLLAGLAGLAFPRRLLTLAGLLVALGAGVELAQAGMALGRQGSWLDLLANTAGIASAAGPVLLLRRGGEAVRR